MLLQGIGVFWCLASHVNALGTSQPVQRAYQPVGADQDSSLDLQQAAIQDATNRVDALQQQFDGLQVADESTQQDAETQADQSQVQAQGEEQSVGDTGDNEDAVTQSAPPSEDVATPPPLSQDAPLPNQEVADAEAGQGTQQVSLPDENQRGTESNSDAAQERGDSVALPQVSVSNDVQSLAPAPAAAAPGPAGAGACGAGDPVTVRPQAGCGPDTVNFGLYAKTFYGVSEKAYTFTIDVVMTLRWKDPRVISLLPTGVPKRTLSAAVAKKSVWLPEVQITNRAIRKFEVISTAILISVTGDVEKVERILATAHSKYDLVMFPFDTQELTVNIASTKYMLQDVVMSPIPDPNLSGMHRKFLDGVPYAIQSVKVEAIEEIDGSLQKSRGLLVLTISRKIDKYANDFLTPAVLMTAISWGVFYFPFVQAFVTPRLALSILALLTFTTQSQKIDKQLPTGVPNNWHTQFVQTVQVLMFCTVIKNVWIEYLHYHFHCDILARQMNHDAKWQHPVLTIVTWTFCFVLWDLTWMKICCMTWIYGFMFVVMFRSVWQLKEILKDTGHKYNVELAKAKKAEEEKKAMHYDPEKLRHAQDQAVHKGVSTGDDIRKNVRLAGTAFATGQNEPGFAPSAGSGGVGTQILRPPAQPFSAPTGWQQNPDAPQFPPNPPRVQL